MSEDKREAILARLLVIGAEVVGNAEHAYRNTIMIQEDARPAFVLLDGDENADDDSDMTRKRPPLAPRIMTMTPELFLMVPEVEPEGAGESENIGTILNRYRRRLIKAVLTDAPLVALSLDGSSIFYTGLTTGLAAGRSIEGEQGLGFSIRYVLRPDRL